MIEFIHYCTITGSTVNDFDYGQDEEHPDCVALKLSLTDKISELCNKGVCDFFTNAEQGLSLWAAEAVVRMRDCLDTPCRLHIIVPYEEQAKKWHEGVRERYYNVHEAADSVTMLQTQYSEDCYQVADRFMLNRSLMLLTDGGNAYLMDYAKSKAKHIEKVSSTIHQ